MQTELRRWVKLCEAAEWRWWLTDPPERLTRYIHATPAAITEAQQTLQALLAADDTIEVWRAMRMHSLSDLGLGAVGRYFTYRKTFAIAYDAGRGGHLYRLHGRLPATSINWRETLEKFGSGEFEITAEDNQPLLFLGIDWITDRGNVVKANEPPGLVGQTLLTGPFV